MVASGQLPQQVHRTAAAAVLWLIIGPGQCLHCFHCVPSLPWCETDNCNPQRWPLCSEHPHNILSSPCRDGVLSCREEFIEEFNSGRAGFLRYCGRPSDQAPGCHHTYSTYNYTYTVCTCRGDDCNVDLMLPPVENTAPRWWLLVLVPVGLALVLAAAGVARAVHVRRTRQPQAV